MEAQEICNKLKKFTNPVRLKILQSLVKGPCNSFDLCQQMPEYDFEKDIRPQLSMLERCGFVISSPTHSSGVPGGIIYWQATAEVDRVVQEVVEGLWSLKNGRKIALVVMKTRNREN